MVVMAGIDSDTVRNIFFDCELENESGKGELDQKLIAVMCQEEVRMYNGKVSYRDSGAVFFFMNFAGNIILYVLFC